MDPLHKELTLLLGKQVSRIELLCHNNDYQQYIAYNQAGAQLPVLVHRFKQPGKAEIIARKILLLHEKGNIRMPKVQGIILSEQAPFYELLITERLPTPKTESKLEQVEKWDRSHRELIEIIRGWHSCEYPGLSGYIDSSQKISWADWWYQRCQVLLILLRASNYSGLNSKQIQLLEHTLNHHQSLFADLTQENVLVHGKLKELAISHEPYLDQLPGLHAPGRITWAPVEYDLYPLAGSSQSAKLLQRYLEKYPVDQGFIWRTDLYALWDEVENIIYQRSSQLQRFVKISARLTPWLAY